MRKIFFLLFILTNTVNFAQSYPFKFTGKIISNFDKKALESATVHLERLKDSTVVSYTISDVDGKFNLTGKTYYKKLRMVVSFMGMKPYQKEIEFNLFKDYNSGIITMYDEQNTLSAVVVKSRAPITVKKDTLEFNVKSFKTKKNATVEELLKKLPGVEVDDNGKIKVNGKPVNNIMVNGKPFFGDDPTIAIRNLTKDIIEKVQVTDTKTKSHAFTGEKGDEENKTINLTIKEENNKGWFGRIAGGFGTDKRYEGAALVNRFDNGQTISVLGSQNNINSPGFSFGEIEKMIKQGNTVIDRNGFEVGGVSFGEGSGLVTSRTLGFSFSDDLKKEMEISLSYFNSNSDAYDNTDSQRTYQLIERSYETTSGSNLVTEGNNHNLQFGFSFEIDSTLQIAIKPKFSKNKQLKTFKSSQKTFNEGETLVNKYTANEFTDSERVNFKNDFTLTKKLAKNGAFIIMNLHNNLEENNSEKRNLSSVELFGSSPSVLDRNQKNDVVMNRNKMVTGTSFRYPIITEKVFVKLAYRYMSDERDNKRSTYDFISSLGDFSSFNLNQSTDFFYTVVEKNPIISLSYDNKRKTYIGLELSYADMLMTSKDALRSNSDFSRTFNNLNYFLNFSHTFKSKMRVSSSYEFNNILPSFAQLVPFTDVSNPSYITTGNPNLNLVKNDNAYIDISKFNWRKRTGFNLSLGVSRNRDVIVRSTSIDENLIRRSTFVNRGSTHGGWLYGSYSKNFKLDSISSVKLSLGLRGNNRKSISIFNNVLSNNEVTSFSPSLALNYDYNKIIMIDPSYKISVSNSEFSNKSQSNNFVSHQFKLKTRVNLLKNKLEWSNDTRYLYNPNLVGFNKSSWFWNSTVSYSVLKDKGAITFKAYDVLNQNTNAIRSAADNYIEDRQSTVLQQYFMLGFSWKFNSLGAKGKTDDGETIFWD